MRKVVGYVRVLETEDGIPDLVVSAYDAPDAPAETEGRALLEPRMPVGRPIASVLTGAGGWFEFNEDDLEFQGNEARPNLLIVVSAPEDIRDADLPLPRPPFKRVLYVSYSARRDAGSHEAYHIRLARETLDRLRIPYGVNHAIASAWRSRIDQRAVLKSLYQAEHNRTQQFRSIAKQKVAKLVGLPRRLFASDVRSGDYRILHKEDLARKLPGLQAKSVKEGVDRLAKTNFALRLNLSEAALKELGLTLKGDKWSGDVTAEKLMTKTRTLLTGGGLVRTRGAEGRSSLDELDRRYPRPSGEPKTQQPTGGNKDVAKPEPSSSGGKRKAARPAKPTPKNPNR